MFRQLIDGKRRERGWLEQQRAKVDNARAAARTAREALIRHGREHGCGSFPHATFVQNTPRLIGAFIS